MRVRRLGYADADAFAEGTKDPAVQEYGHLPLPEYTPQVVREQIDGVIADGLRGNEFAVLAVADAATDAFLGSIVLFDVRPDQAEVGYWLGPWARGRGAAKRALLAATRLAGAAGLRRLEAKTSPDNAASQRVLDGAGFRQVGGIREETAPSGEVVRLVTYEYAL